MGLKKALTCLVVFSGLILGLTACGDEEATVRLPDFPINITGPVTTVAGLSASTGSTDGVGAAARFNAPLAPVSDGTYLYIPEYFNHTIRRMHLASRAVTTLAGTALSSGYVDATGAAARFNNPVVLAFVNGALYLADRSTHTIRKINPNTGAVSTFAGTNTPGSVDAIGGAARFNQPHAVASDGFFLYVVDHGSHLVRRINLSTRQVTTLAGLAASPGFVNGIGAAARFNQPKGVAYHNGYLYIGDFSNHSVRRLDLSTNRVTTLAGTGAPGYVDSSNGLTAQFNGLEGVVTDGFNIYVGDGLNHVIRRVSISTGAVSTVAGLAGSASVVDGSLAAARFNKPIGLTIVGDALYVSDFNGETIRRID